MKPKSRPVVPRDRGEEEVENIYQWAERLQIDDVDP